MDNLGKEIVKLYQSGLSAQQVSDELHISGSKVRYALAKQSVPLRNHSSASRMLHLTKFGKKQCCVKNNLTDDEEHLRIAGIMLYWGEGTKSGSSVMFSNSDPQMVKLFLSFLRKICRVEEYRLRILLHIYDNQNEKSLKKLWSTITEIPLSQFSKTYYHSGQKGTYKKTCLYGTISLRYSDNELLKIINNWIGEYKTPM